MQILVAEDVTVIQKLMQRMLRPYGEVTFACDGKEAFQQFRNTLNTKNYFDLICLDINLPKINGLDVLKNIRSVEKINRVSPKEQAKIVIVSSTNDANVVVKAIKLGCDGYIVKPISQEKIVAELKKLNLIKEEKQSLAATEKTEAKANTEVGS